MLNTPRFATTSIDDLPSEFRSTSFSDNVVVSAPISPNDLAAVLHFCFQFSWILLNHGGHLCRGAIVKGPLHHGTTEVFGKGLVDAYQIENKIADFPRIIVTQNVRNDIIRFSDRDSYLRDFLPRTVKSEDGPFFIDIFTPISAIKNRWTIKKPGEDGEVTAEEDNEYVAFCRMQVRQSIMQRLDEATDTPTIYRKIKWFARQFNSSVGVNTKFAIPLERTP